MLIVKVYVNTDKIDEIWIHNRGERFDVETGAYEYRIEKPKGYNDIPILHIRDDGYGPLVRKALKTIDDVKKEKMYIKWLRKNGAHKRDTHPLPSIKKIRGK